MGQSEYDEFLQAACKVASALSKAGVNVEQSEEGLHVGMDDDALKAYLRSPDAVDYASGIVREFSDKYLSGG